MTRWPALRFAVLSASLAAAASALAQSPPAAPPNPPSREQAQTPEPPRGIDSLFDRLAKAEDEEEAKGIANLIERRWLRSSSDVADLLMSRALVVMQPKDQDLPQAVELLDRIIGLEPQWAEAYNKRATAFFMLGDLQRSALDVRETLAREPRHYGAMAGLGHIMLATGDKKRAMEAFSRALALNPRMPNIKGVVERLRPEVEGRDI